MCVIEVTLSDFAGFAAHHQTLHPSPELSTRKTYDVTNWGCEPQISVYQRCHKASVAVWSLQLVWVGRILWVLLITPAAC